MSYLMALVLIKNLFLKFINFPMAIKIISCYIPETNISETASIFSLFFLAENKISSTCINMYQRKTKHFP